ncbi:MAG: TetR/AcrR family transcriptional regulator [Oscillospiraceae bacterium]
MKNELEKRDILRMSNEESHQITKECLQTALILLMGEKPFEKITITELVKRSGVSRTAFYRNYNSKEDILNEISTDITNAIAQAFTSDKYAKEPYEWYVEMFANIRKNKKEFDLLLRADMTTNLFENAIQMLKKINVDNERKYVIGAALGAHVAIIIEWFKNGLNESDEKMAEICLCAKNSLEKGFSCK